MDDLLSDVDVRVLGSLIEKETTTPDNYPMSLNALVAACNQTTNRDPVMHLDEDTVARTIDGLRRRGLVRAVQRIDARVIKYQHLASDALGLYGRERAAMCVLMLRGPQTAGEIRTRAGRLADFERVEQVETSLETLMARAPSPLVARLPRQPGQKETRYTQLLSTDAERAAAAAEATGAAGAAEAPAGRGPNSHDRVTALETTVDELRRELAELRARFEEFAQQFR